MVARKIDRQQGDPGSQRRVWHPTKTGEVRRKGEKVR